MSAHLFQLPIENPVLIFALVMLLVLVVPLLVERLGLPGLIGLIVAGAVVGPQGLNLLARDSTFVLLGTVGILYLMFIVGVEVDLHQFGRMRRRSAILGTLSFALPQSLGLVAAVLVLGYDLWAAILLGSVLASHTLLGYPIASRLGIAKNPAVTTAVGGTILTDVVALLVLTVVASATRGSLDGAFWLRLGVSLLIFATLVLVGLPAIGRWFFRTVEKSDAAEFVFVLAALFVCAVLAEVAGVEPIIGAFFAGLAINRLIPAVSTLMNRIVFVGEALFIPFFLLSVGMLVDMRVLAGSPRSWLVAGTLVICVVVAKWAAAMVSGLLFRQRGTERWLMFGLTIPQAAATLAATLVGFQLAIFDQEVVNGVIVMILVTCLIGPWVVDRFGRRVALEMESEVEAPANAPQRILVSLSNPATSKEFMELAMLLRDKASPEPIFPLAVVADGSHVGAQVIAAEKLLGKAVVHAASASVPVQPLTRVDMSIASGITRAVTESRIATVILGGSPPPSARQRIFGTVGEHVVHASTQMIIVAWLGRPLNLTRRMVVILPPGSERSSGFLRAAEAVKTLATQIGAPMVGLVPGRGTDGVEHAFERARPTASIAWEPMTRWNRILPWLAESGGTEEDLVVLVTARKGNIAWAPHVDSFARRLTRKIRGNLLVIYLPELAEDARPAYGGESALAPVSLPAGLRREHILWGLPREGGAAAVEAVLRTALDNESLLRVAVRAIMHRQEEHSMEIAPGVVVLHLRLDRVSHRICALGVDEAGVPLAGTAAPVSLMFVILVPRDYPPEQHLQGLAEIARVVREGSFVERLRPQVLALPAGGKA